MNHFLKAADEATLQAALIAAGILVVATVPVIEIIEGIPTQVGEQPAFALSGGFALDTIGTISKPTGAVVTVNGLEVPEMTEIPGCHANLLGELSDEQRAALGDVLLPAPPTNPFRVWAS
ncbi:hypothetical protein GBK02_09220 [Dechloromonas sp. TW-R-39-2]|uniref:hypothetical protein n=1 Tax=Dechloromonas sp. TW-R-39-2 TaxID=2654218 RepID=UPI00193E6AE3|nr:hypothetical protein [Dechloromonas sp. TW-R-39-2]QRM19569.1 hypothetical protein GBK02_09220 [Dechloromonas sp. TW-R-39-2]